MNKLILIHILALTLVSCAKPPASEPTYINVEPLPVAEEPSSPTSCYDYYYDGYETGFNNGYNVGFNDAEESALSRGKGPKPKKDKND